VFLPGRQMVNTVDATAGSGVGSGGGSAVLQTSSTRLVATVDLPASSQSEAYIGEHVTVEMPSRATVGGRVTAVSRIAQSSSSSGSSARSSLGSGGSGSGAGAGNAPSGSSTIPVTISLDKQVNGAGLDQAPVSVNLAHAHAEHVLSVPVTALIATSGDRYAVQEAVAPHRLLPVHTGLFAAGYVQVSGPAIHAGLRVTDAQG
jgi:hypothetical protein